MKYREAITEEMLACLKNEDGIVIRWRVDI